MDNVFFLENNDNDNDTLLLSLGIAGGLTGFIGLVLILVLIRHRNSLQDRCRRK